MTQELTCRWTISQSAGSMAASSPGEITIDHGGPDCTALAASIAGSMTHCLPTQQGKASLTSDSRVPSHAVTSSNPEAVSAALTEILSEDMNVDIRRVTRESRLIDDVGLDSVAFAVGMVAIEDKLGVALSEEDLLSCDTVGDLEAAILAKVPAGQPNS